MDQAKILDCWQERPEIFRGAIATDHPALAVDWEDLKELLTDADLDLNARLVQHCHLDYPKWKVSEPPFQSAEIKALAGQSSWSVLINQMEHLYQPFEQLKYQFQFLRQWRLDDIMLSYSTEGGSVGPHLDHYDVFLIQASGQRRWQVGGERLNSEEILDGTPLRILKEPKFEHDWVLEPGDMLYVPAEYAHWGIAKGEGMTISVGFRAPSLSEVLYSWVDQCVAELDSFSRFKDSKSGLASACNSLEITGADVDELFTQLQGAFTKGRLAQAMGKLVTDVEPKEWAAAETADEIFIDPACRFATTLNEAGEYLIWINSHETQCPKDLYPHVLEIISERHQLPERFQPDSDQLEAWNWLKVQIAKSSEPDSAQGGHSF